MFSILRLIFRLTLLLLLIALVAGYLTNPTKDDFSKEVEHRLNAEMKSKLNNPAFEDIAEQSTSFFSELADKWVTRNNFFVCSVFTVKMPNGTYNYLGAFQHFFPLQSENPLDELKGADSE